MKLSVSCCAAAAAVLVMNIDGVSGLKMMKLEDFKANNEQFEVAAKVAGDRKDNLQSFLESMPREERRAQIEKKKADMTPAAKKAAAKARGRREARRIQTQALEEAGAVPGSNMMSTGKGRPTSTISQEAGYDANSGEVNLMYQNTGIQKEVVGVQPMPIGTSDEIEEVKMNMMPSSLASMENRPPTSNKPVPQKASGTGLGVVQHPRPAVRRVEARTEDETNRTLVSLLDTTEEDKATQQKKMRNAREPKMPNTAAIEQVQREKDQLARRQAGARGPMQH